MYLVELYHFGPKYRNGDREEGTTLIESKAFRLKKEAKSYVLWQTNGRKIYESWGTGNNPSYISWCTGKTFVNENSGETREEKYYYKIVKQ